MFYRTMACLPALTGAWRHRGGGLMRSVGSWQDALVDEHALARPDLLAGRTVRTLNMSRLGEILLDEQAPVQAMIVWNVNPLVSIPNGEAIRRGLERDDLFVVVHEQFMTDTARYADIVLPATTHIEASDVTTAWGHLWMGWNEAAIAPLGEAVNNPECFRRIARSMGLTEPSLYDDDMTLLRAALPTIDVDALRRDGWFRVPFPEDGLPWSNGGFPTPSGKVEFVSARLEAQGQPALPTFIPPREGPTGPDAARYPLQLMTPKYHSRFLNSSYSPLPKHGPAEGEPFVELDPADADARGLADGDRARIFNDRASLELPVRIGDRVRPGLAIIPWGWWRTQHADGRNANALTNDTLTDWGGGVAYSDTLVEVARASG
jgi:anaerobic selenocysteine-containing dehydrogenase